MKDYIDWSIAPDWAKWCAVDEDGTLNYFEDSGETPSIRNEDNGYGYWGPGAYGFDWEDGDSSAVIGPLPPWKDSLIERP